MIVDLPFVELEEYAPLLTEQPDFDAFWAETLAESADQPLNIALESRSYPVDRVQIHAVSFDGFGPRTRVQGWYLTPRDHYRYDSNRLPPTIVQYHGYNMSRGVPAQYLHWALQGFAVLAIDTRGQNGDTPDNAVYTSGNTVGMLAKGIDDPRTYYYRYAYMDAFRAVQVARELAPAPIVVTGVSQGGGMSLAVAALAGEGQIAAALPDVPFLCHVQRAVEVSTTGPYAELVAHWRVRPGAAAAHFRTLSYFDGLNFAPRITGPVLMSVALLDTTCPPSTGFAVYNHLATNRKRMCVYPYSGHEGGQALHDQEKYGFVRACLEGAIESRAVQPTINTGNGDGSH